MIYRPATLADAPALAALGAEIVRISGNYDASVHEAARLAVMLPSPKFFENRQNSAYLARRTGTIVARMGAVSAP